MADGVERPSDVDHRLWAKPPVSSTGRLSLSVPRSLHL